MECVLGNVQLVHIMFEPASNQFRNANPSADVPIIHPPPSHPTRTSPMMTTSTTTTTKLAFAKVKVKIMTMILHGGHFVHIQRNMTDARVK